MTLKQKTFAALRWTTVAALARTLLQLMQIAVLARLLSPEDYGLMAMVGVVLAFGSIFADMGVNSAYVQRQDVTQEQRSSLFWLNAGVSVALTLLVIVFSPLIARVFGDTRLTLLLMLAASTFVINALGQQVRMTAEKALDFQPVVLLEIGAALFGFAAGVSAAIAGWGVHSLILASIVSAMSGTVLAWLFLARGWRPLWRFRMEDVNSFLSFGGALVANNILNEFNRGVDLLLGGRMLGAATLGLYSLPRQVIFQIQGVVNPIITRVGFPLIAQVQADIPRVRSIYLKTLNMTAATNAPLYVGLAFFAPEAVSIMLGDKWLGSADLLRLLALWGFMRSTGNPVGSLLLGMGRADLSLQWNLAMLLLVPPVLWVGAQSGTIGLAWALLGFQTGMFVPGWYVLVRPLCNAGLYEYSVAALRPCLLAALSVAAGYFSANQFSGSVLRIAIAAGVAAPVYLLISYKANHEWFTALTGVFGRRIPASQV